MIVGVGWLGGTEARMNGRTAARKHGSMAPSEAGMFP